MFSAKIQRLAGVDDAVRHLLGELFTNKCARTVSWAGTSGLKVAFKETNMLTAIESKVIYLIFGLQNCYELNMAVNLV